MLKSLFALSLMLLLASCSTVEDLSRRMPKGEPETFYWHSTKMTADTTPDIVKAQALLEDDLVACGYAVYDRQRWIDANDPVSIKNKHAVDKKGVPRSYTDLPTVYELDQCMEKRGWVKLKHYYTIPY